MSAEQSIALKRYFKEHPEDISAVVPFDKGSDELHPLNFTASNTELDPAILEDTEAFSDWVRLELASENCRYGIGGYNEHRTIYSRSALFDMDEEPRRLHLGVDIWGPKGTPVFSPLSGKIHSFRFNNNFGDYGATLILEHQAENLIFHTLYGHLKLSSIDGLVKDLPVKKGQMIAEFGDIIDNGHWPPHLHFQLIFDMGNFEGDYPGVCRYSERELFLSNCPDPELILKHTFRY
ncbi:peptidoglycan DD-metalloendopeptidase family protein [Daejeonella sp.]|uniref:peptidoglycan DD-metalloendopeptidase family protein n=1 Tax=Daejeonella sp. TaxID=2805397 RepID=UPI0030C135D5